MIIIICDVTILIINPDTVTHMHDHQVGHRWTALCYVTPQQNTLLHL